MWEASFPQSHKSVTPKALDGSWGWVEEVVAVGGWRPEIQASLVTAERWLTPCPAKAEVMASWHSEGCSSGQAGTHIHPATKAGGSHCLLHGVPHGHLIYYHFSFTSVKGGERKALPTLIFCNSLRRRPRPQNSSRWKCSWNSLLVHGQCFLCFFVS